MKLIFPVVILMVATNFFSLYSYAQNARPDPEPFSFSSSATNKLESKEITMLRNSYQQFMRAVTSSKNHHFNQIRSASNIMIGSTEEESLQYLLETSRIIRKELVEQLPNEFLLEELKNYNALVSTSKQGMILGLRKDLDLYRSQMANSR